MAFRERLLSEYIPWSDYVGRDVIISNDGSVLMMLQTDGLPAETDTDEVINFRHEQLEHSLRDVGTIGLTYYFLQCRGIADSSFYPKGQFHTPFAENLDRRYRDKLFSSRSIWLNQSFLVLELSPRAVIGGNVMRRLLPTFGMAGALESVEERIERLKRIVGILEEELKEYRPRRLGVVKRNGFYFTEIGEALAFAMTGYWRMVPMTTSDPSAIFSEPFIVGSESFEVRMPHGSTWGACLGMHDFPYMTFPGMFDKFLSARYRHTIFHGFRCMAPVDGEKIVTRKQNRMRQSGDRALSQASDLTTAANLIASNRLMMGQYAFALTVFVDDYSRLSEIIQYAWGDLSSGGIKVERENAALEAVLFSMVPGNFHLRGREAAISSRNFAAFAPMHNFSVGENKGFWGGPVCMFRNSGGGPFLFHFHTNGVGNCFISGQTGTGKTTLIGFLICQAERTGAQVVLWDKDHGLEAVVRALSGSYLALSNTPDIGTGLAPLKRLTDSPEDLAFLAALIRACISTPTPYDMTPEEDRRLPIGLKYVMRLPPEKRTLWEVRAFLGTSRTGAGARLEKWCAGNEFGWIIDCEKDIVTLDDRVIAFDQSALLDDPIASGAVMTTLFHYTGKLVDGRRLLFILDEVWKALEIEQFHGEIHNGMKTWRKYNAPIIVATQDVADGLKSPIGHTLRNQTPTQIYFSNPNATWTEHGPEGMHLTTTEFDIVKRLPKGRGHFLLKQSDRADVLQAPLDGLDEVKVISGTRIGSDALKLARERTNDASGLELVEEYHRALEELAQ